MTTRITSENITDATIGTADLASSVPLNTQWQPVKTATFTAVAGEGYFVNSGSALTMNLPAGVAGATIVVADYARNFSTYNLTISPNGSEKIGGVAENATLNVDGQAATFVYVDATKGWINVQNAEDTEVGVPPFISATGGTITESGDFRIHTFTGDGCFVVTSLATESPAPIYNTVSYLVVAGGGGAGAGSTPAHAAGGGGAGGGRVALQKNRGGSNTKWVGDGGGSRAPVDTLVREGGPHGERARRVDGCSCGEAVLGRGPWLAPPVADAAVLVAAPVGALALGRVQRRL